MEQESNEMGSALLQLHLQSIFGQKVPEKKNNVINSQQNPLKNEKAKLSKNKGKEKKFSELRSKDIMNRLVMICLFLLVHSSATREKT